MGTESWEPDAVVGETIGVVSLNVCGLPSALPPVKERAVEFCRRLEESDVDIVNLQEVWTRGVLRFIATRMPSFGAVAWRRGVAGQPAGGLVTFSRLPMGAPRFTSFGGARPRQGSLVFRGLKAVNSRLQGVLTVMAGPALIANVHLSANRDGDWSEGNRHHGFQRAQLAALRNTIRPGDAKLAILSGDMNLPSTGPLYGALTDGWRDPFAADDRPTFHRELLPAGRTPHRIDYLLVSGDPERYPVTEAAILFEEAPFLSDHCALMARVALAAPSS